MSCSGSKKSCNGITVRFIGLCVLYSCINQDHKEDLQMKTATYYRHTRVNQANTPFRSEAAREMLNKFVDMLLTAAIGAGAAAIVLFLSVLA